MILKAPASSIMVGRFAVPAVGIHVQAFSPIVERSWGKGDNPISAIFFMIFSHRTFCTQSTGIVVFNASVTVIKLFNSAIRHN